MISEVETRASDPPSSRYARHSYTYSTESQLCYSVVSGGGRGELLRCGADDDEEDLSLNELGTYIIKTGGNPCTLR